MPEGRAGLTDAQRIVALQHGVVVLCGHIFLYHGLFLGIGGEFLGLGLQTPALEHGLGISDVHAQLFRTAVYGVVAHFLAGAGEPTYGTNAVDPQQLLQNAQRTTAFRFAYAASAIGGVDHAINGGLIVALGAGGTGCHRGIDDAGNAGMTIQPLHGVEFGIARIGGVGCGAHNGLASSEAQQLIDCLVGQARHD